MTIRLVLLVDVRAYRAGLSCSLENAQDIHVVGAAATGRAGIDVVGDLRPDVVLLDLALLDRLTTAWAIRKDSPDTGVVALGVPETEQHVVACAEAGILGYVPQEAPIPYVIASVRRAARGETLCSPRMAAGLVRRLAASAGQRAGSSARPVLTKRQQEILALINEGRSNKEISRQLCIAVTTVKNHVHSILEKLEVHRRAEAAAYMRRMDSGAGGTPIGLQRDYPV